MGHSRSRWTQDTPNTDGQIFIGAGRFKDTSGNSTTASAGAGLFTLNQAASKASTYFSEISEILRTGMLATPNLNQEQFGTALLQPGPSSVAGTSGPLALSGFPPYTNTTNPTVTGGVSGSVKKGIQINWFDVIYDVEAVNLAAATCGLTTTKFTNLTAPTVANIVALAANSLPVAYSAGVAQRTRVTPATPAFVTLDGCEVIINVNLTTPAGGTSLFYGVVFGVSFNFN